MNITETKAREYMNKRERDLRDRLIAMLKDDGKGHKHAKYAERLADFNVKIVPTTVDPDMTAAVSFEESVIYISDGFLSDPSTFFQLNVLMRHELAHALLMHQIRMMYKITEKYGDDGYTHIKMSMSLHSLMNVIEDFEISNKRYTSEDKITVRNMWLNGRVIGGLVTEDHRQNWQNMSVEEMYDALSDEIDNIQKAILSSWNTYGSVGPEISAAALGQSKDFIMHNIADLYSYTDISNPSELPPIDQLIKSSGFSNFADTYKEIVLSLYDALNAKTQYTESDYTAMLTDIAKSSPTQPINVTLPDTGEVVCRLYTPEEKYLASNVLKSLCDEANEDAKWRRQIKLILVQSGHGNAADIDKIYEKIQEREKANAGNE